MQTSLERPSLLYSSLETERPSLLYSFETDDENRRGEENVGVLSDARTARGRNERLRGRR